MTSIYALKQCGNIIYIGQTVNIKRRMEQHWTNVNLIGVSYEIIEECEDKEALKRERFYIKKYLSEGCKLINKNHTKDKKLDEIDIEILQLLADDKKSCPVS